MRYIKINPNDNVVVALTDLQAGEAAEGVVLKTDVPRGHKILLVDAAEGDNVIKYGFPIGHLTRAAKAGEMIDHNSIKTNLEGLLGYEYHPEISPLASLGRNDREAPLGRNDKAVSLGRDDNPPVISSVGRQAGVEKSRSFMGYRRSDGQVGIRNQIWIIPTVGCVNGICQTLAERFREEISPLASLGRDDKESPLGRDDREASLGRDDKESPLGRDDKEAPLGRNDKEAPLGRDDKESPLGRDDNPPVISSEGRRPESRNLKGLRSNASTNPCGSVDAVVAFPHNYGCSQLGGDHENTRTILADMVHHPNAGGVLVVSLGCENNQLDAFRSLVGEVDETRVKMFVCQQVDNEIEYGLECLREIYSVCSKDVREEIPVSELRVGLKCGGSDGLSGITANPLLGVFSDWLVGQGGTTVLTEVPEMFGAETILMNRCQDRATFDKTVALINDFKEYFIKQGMPVYENPSPGNKAGGISTLEEKSLGCTQKCGSSIVRGVLRYGERLQSKGLNLLSAPGNDLVASSALAASGCQIVLFTTGRGTPFGSFVPTMKISTNTPLGEGKKNWIDFNAGVLVEGEPMESVAARFTEYVLAVASGDSVNNEKNGFRELAIFKQGVTL